MSDDCDRYKTVCQDEFVELHRLCGTPHKACNAESRIMQSCCRLHCAGPIGAGCIGMDVVIVLCIIRWLLMSVSLQQLQELQQFVVRPEAESAAGRWLKRF